MRKATAEEQQAKAERKERERREATWEGSHRLADLGFFEQHGFDPHVDRCALARFGTRTVDAWSRSDFSGWMRTSLESGSVALSFLMLLHVGGVEESALRELVRLVNAAGM